MQPMSGCFAAGGMVLTRLHYFFFIFGFGTSKWRSTARAAGNGYRTRILGYPEFFACSILLYFRKEANAIIFKNLSLVRSVVLRKEDFRFSRDQYYYVSLLIDRARVLRSITPNKLGS